LKGVGWIVRSLGDMVVVVVVVVVMV
jgi:hypothetical protein